MNSSFNVLSAQYEHEKQKFLVLCFPLWAEIKYTNQKNMQACQLLFIYKVSPMCYSDTGLSTLFPLWSVLISVLLLTLGFVCSFSLVSTLEKVQSMLKNTDFADEENEAHWD